jgi:hypothetical protein
MEMSFSIPPGPYFLGELLRTTVSLANIASKPIAYWGAPWDAPCGSTLSVALTGGVPPRFGYSTLNCPGAPPVGLPTGTLISKGQRISLHPLVALTASGPITLTAQAAFVGTRIIRGTQTPAYGAGPFGSGFPALRLTVITRAPANRVLRQVRVGTRISIQPPYSNLRGVVANWVQICVESMNGNPVGGEGITGTGGFLPMVNNTIVDPLCPGGHGKLEVDVGAPGLGIDHEVYCQNPIPIPLFSTANALMVSSSTPFGSLRCTRTVH